MCKSRPWCKLHAGPVVTGRPCYIRDGCGQSRGSPARPGPCICSVVRLTGAWAPTRRGRDAVQQGRPCNLQTQPGRGVKASGPSGACGICWAFVCGDGPCSAAQSTETPPPKEDSQVPSIDTWESAEEGRCPSLPLGGPEGTGLYTASPSEGTVDLGELCRGPEPSSFPDLPAATPLVLCCCSHLHWVGCT